MKYKTILDEYTSEYEIKKSKFIGHIKHIESEKEALNFIKEVKTVHWDAKHNVYAYLIKENKISRYTDDGEPSGTAGMPVLDVLSKNDIFDTAIVVTRYFGGILLGTGGLVRAYSYTAKLALQNAEIVTMTSCEELRIECEYSLYEKINKLITYARGSITNTKFEDKVKIWFYLPKETVNQFRKDVNNISSGKVAISYKKDIFSPVCNKIKNKK